MIRLYDLETQTFQYINLLRQSGRDRWAKSNDSIEVCVFKLFHIEALRVIEQVVISLIEDK